MLLSRRFALWGAFVWALAGVSLAGANGQLLLPPQGLTTAGMPRIELNSDSRYVLFRGEALALLAGAEVSLGNDERLIVPVDLPLGFRQGGPLAIEAEISVSQIEDPGRANALDMARTPRLRLRSEFLEWNPGRAPTLRLRFDIPEELRGRRGRLRAIVRNLTGPRRVASVGPIAAPRAASLLSFSYGVEPRSWKNGAPPLRFRVSLRSDGNEERILWERMLDPARDPRDRSWREASLRLAATEDTSLVLLFSVEVVGLPGATAQTDTAGVFANPVLRADGAPDQRRNVILISLDTLRASSVGAYGYERGTTPQIDRRMAQAGTLARQAIAPMPFTPASHMTMLTGLDPCEHLVLGLEDQLAADQPTLAEILRDVGYETAAFTENAYLVAGGGFDRGFDSYRENRSDESRTDGLARETFAAATAWLAGRKHTPFFLFLHTYQVHRPYSAPRAYEALLPDTPGLVAPENLRDLYDREIRYLDDIVGDFLDSIDRLGLAENTLIVLTSDHGEGFAETEFDGSGHGLKLYDSETRVPLIFRGPGLVQEAATIEPVVGLIDLTPTILDLLKVPQPAPTTGRSFAGWVRGDDRTFVERPVFSRPVALGREPGAALPAGGVTALRTSQWKRLHRAGYPGQLFSIIEDPRETSNVVTEQPEVVARLDTLIQEHEDWCDQMQQERRSGSGISTRRPAWLDDMTANMRDKQADVARKLEALGYIE
jgi:arylsulfatase A-like enzyme